MAPQWDTSIIRNECHSAIRLQNMERSGSVDITKMDGKEGRVHCDDKVA